MKIFLSFVTVLVLLGGCSQTGTFETELMQLGYQEKTILCTLEVLHSRISNEWDGINALLEANLPPDMPKEEKFNMLNVRNANLIRMFESFQTIDPEIKQALDTVEQADVDMRKEILALKAQAQRVESQKMALFEKISRTAGTAALGTYRNLYNNILRETCN